MAIEINMDFVKKIPGILKICQLVLGTICLSLAAHYAAFNNSNIIVNQSECFFLTMSVTYFTGTLLLLLSSLFSINTESLLRKTLFESMYHAFACIMYFSGSVAVLAGTRNFPNARYDAFMAAGGIGIINSILYGVSTFYSYNAYVNE